MHSRLLATCAAAAVTVWLAPMAAQAAAPADSNGTTTLPEVLVQARRVTEDQQKTPVAVTAINKDILRLDTTTEVTEIQKDVPNFVIQPSQLGGDAAPSFTIRGLSTSILADPSVVSYVDGVVQDPRNFAYQFYDLDSVQVLKGPQGTLFGKNSTGGALLLQPTHPGNEFGGWLDARFGNYNDREFTGAINLPVNDTLAFRISGEWEQRDGTVESVNSGLKYDNRNHDSFRAEMEWKPTEWFDNYLSVTTYRVRQQNNTPLVIGLNTSCPPPSPAGFPTGLGECYFEFPATLGLGTVDIGQEFAQQQTLGKDKTVNATPLPFDVDYDGVTDIAQFKFGDGLMLRNIAHGDWSAYDIVTDLDGTNAPLVDQTDIQNNHFWSDELQLLGKSFDNRLNWIVGAYYSDFRSNESQDLHQLDFPGNPLGEVLVHDIQPSTSSALFAQGTWDFGDWVKGLSLTAGYRYTWDHKSFTDTRLAPAAAAPPPFGFGTDCALLIFGIAADPATCTRSQSAHWSDDNYNVSLNWQATDHVLLYVATRKGYKAGGFNFASSSPALVSYAPEELKDVEVGVKADWYVGMPVRTNIAIYRGDYTDIQADFEDFSGPIPQLLIINKDPVTGAANKATMEGVEAEVTIIPVRGVTITGYYAYAQGKYDQFVDRSNPFFPVNLHGQSISGIVPNTEGLTFTWAPDMPDRWGKPVFGAFLYHQGRQSSNVESSSLLPEAAFTNLDLRLDWRNVGGSPVDLAVYGKNVTNDRHLTNGEDLTGLANIQAAEYAEPRMYGVELRYHFGASH
ncbi:MAG TPA: TonB-dependent receptor [Caulobacteraceae bacterium]|jgi:iron complex outermembrane receptor protein|nr:TonB-dependent receptor [Caulobacteraceae bacterium]